MLPEVLMAVLNPRGGKTAKPEEIRRRFPPFPPLPPPGIKMGISALNSSNFSPQFFLFINNPPSQSKEGKIEVKRGGGKERSPAEGGSHRPPVFGEGGEKGVERSPPRPTQGGEMAN